MLYISCFEHIAILAFLVTLSLILLTVLLHHEMKRERPPPSALKRPVKGIKTTYVGLTVSYDSLQFRRFVCAIQAFCNVAQLWKIILRTLIEHMCSLVKPPLHSYLLDIYSEPSAFYLSSFASLLGASKRIRLFD